jgi:hypothetical protein
MPMMLAASPLTLARAMLRYAGVVAAAVAICGTIAVANVPAARAVAATPLAAKVHKHPHCDACGVIQAIRRVDAADGHAPTYEITIRLRDGSTRTNRNATPGNWRAGDRIMLINGGRAAIAPTT